MAYLRILLAALLIAACAPAAAALQAFACTPEWGALLREIGGSRTVVHVATTALQDPHRIEARPSLIAAARRADLVLCTGAGLEGGWLPLVIAQSGNARIQPRQPGYFEAASVVPLLERPASVDRAMGDVHPEGNPHLHLDPRNIARIADALAVRLASLDPGGAAEYRKRTSAFLARWRQATEGWEMRAARLRGTAIVVYHRDLTYLLAWLGMRAVGSLEPKPGLPPTAAHLNELLAGLAREPAQAVVRSAYSDPRAAQWLAERARLPVVTLPFTVGGTERAQDLFGLFEDTLARLLAAIP